MHRWCEPLTPLTRERGSVYPKFALWNNMLITVIQYTVDNKWFSIYYYYCKNTISNIFIPWEQNTNPQRIHLVTFIISLIKPMTKIQFFTELYIHLTLIFHSSFRCMKYLYTFRLINFIISVMPYKIALSSVSCTILIKSLLFLPRQNVQISHFVNWYPSGHNRF